jgi:predicted flavoprotein YhiN
MEPAEGAAGGVRLEETNFKTMESKVVPGLYLIGEILTVMAGSVASTFNGPG